METNDYPRVGGRTMRTTTAAAVVATDIGNSIYYILSCIYIQYNMLYNIIKVGPNCSGNVSRILVDEKNPVGG